MVVCGFLKRICYCYVPRRHSEMPSGSEWNRLTPLLSFFFFPIFSFLFFFSIARTHALHNHFCRCALSPVTRCLLLPLSVFSIFCRLNIADVVSWLLSLCKFCFSPTRSLRFSWLLLFVIIYRCVFLNALFVSRRIFVPSRFCCLLLCCFILLRCRNLVR